LNEILDVEKKIKEKTKNIIEEEMIVENWITTILLLLYC
jgi:hypothetical protein